MFGSRSPEFILSWISDGERKETKAKNWTELFRSLESLQWQLLKGGDISSLEMREINELATPRTT